MKLEDLKKALDKVGIPVAYASFHKEDNIKPPFIVYFSLGKDNFAADGIVYSKQLDIQVELYTDYKMPDLEKKLEKVLDELEIYYTNEEVYIEEEKMILNIYNMEV